MKLLSSFTVSEKNPANAALKAAATSIDHPAGIGESRSRRTN